VSDIQSVVAAAIGGENIGETVEGLERFPINVRYPRETRDSVQKLRDLPLLTERGAQIRLGDVAAIGISDGPPMLKSENARLSGWVYVDLRGRDLRSAVRDMQRAVAREVRVPAGYSISWSGQFEYLARAMARLKVVVPATLLIIFVLLYLTFRRFQGSCLDHDNAASCARGRVLAHVPARLQHVDCFCSRIHSSGRRCGGGRGCDAGVPQPGDQRPGGGGAPE